MIVRALKGLEDVAQLVEANNSQEDRCLAGSEAGRQKDPLYGFKHVLDFYEKAYPGYCGKVTVPMLWDTKKGKC